MERRLTLEECDMILQGAVVLGCGGGGPLNFARHLLHELDNTHLPQIAPKEAVTDDDWLAMVALVGTPSKVHHPRRRRLRNKSQTPPPSPLSPLSGQESKNRKNILLSDPDYENWWPKSHKSGSLRPSFYEIARYVMRINFFCSVFTGDTMPDPGDPCSPKNAVRNTFALLQKQCLLRACDNRHYDRYRNFKKICYVLTGELGAVNMATALYLSATFGVPVVDCDGAGRSVPLVNQVTYAGEFSLSLTAFVSPQSGQDFDNIASTILDLSSGSEKMVEEVAVALISDETGPFHPYIGYGTYVITGAEMGDTPVIGSYTAALNIGRILETSSGTERAAKIAQALTCLGRPASVVFHGRVTEKVLLNNNVKDTGYLVVSSLEDPGKVLKLWYKNEIILAGTPNEHPLYMAPDSICIIPARGPAVDISTILEDENFTCPEVFILVAQADKKIKTDKLVKSFENIYKVFKSDDGSTYYNGNYIPWCREEFQVIGKMTCARVMT